MAVVGRLVAGFPPRRFAFNPRLSHVGFMVGKMAVGWIFSEYFAPQIFISTTAPVFQSRYIRVATGGCKKRTLCQPTNL
jgi:hypothetical protein